MNIFVVFIILLAATQRCAQQSETTLLNVHERVALLKHQISQNIKRNIRHNHQLLPLEHDAISSGEYEDIDVPITPIGEHDERKKEKKYLLRQLKTTTDTPRSKTTKTGTKPMRNVATDKKVKIVADELSSSNENIPLKGIDHIFAKSTKTNSALRHKKSLEKSSKIFYRRIFSGDLKKHCAKQLLHCQDLITPFLTGQRQNMTDVRSIKYTDHVVIRLVQLLNEDTSEMSKEEIYSILYQISNLQVRLFQWELSAIKLLLNTITKEKAKRHSFRSVKRGLKHLLATWHLDYHNVTGLLQQTRLFRPPCVQSHLSEGSTLSSHAVRYTRPSTKKKCSPNTEENTSSCEL